MTPAPLLAAMLLAARPETEDPLDPFAESNRLFETARSDAEPARAAGEIVRLLDGVLR